MVPGWSGLSPSAPSFLGDSASTQTADRNSEKSLICWQSGDRNRKRRGGLPFHAGWAPETSLKFGTGCRGARTHFTAANSVSIGRPHTATCLSAPRLSTPHVAPVAVLYLIELVKTYLSAVQRADLGGQGALAGARCHSWQPHRLPCPALPQMKGRSHKLLSH